MRVTYDKQADMCYIYFVDKVKNGECVRQKVVYNKSRKMDAVIDFDKDGKMVGIEIFGSRLLRKETLDLAKDITKKGRKGKVR